MKKKEKENRSNRHLLGQQGMKKKPSLKFKKVKEYVGDGATRVDEGQKIPHS